LAEPTDPVTTAPAERAPAAEVEIEIEAAGRDRPFWLVNAVVSILALGLLAYLLLVRQADPGDAGAFAFMPAVNAAFNASAAVFLVLAVVAIKRGQIRRHQVLTLSAFASSTLFLVGYLAYHYVHGDTRYPEGGGMRGLYLAVLASHVILSVPVVPLCLAAFYYAFRRSFRTHRTITKVLFPIWLYVSVTGVIVFAMLRSAHG
jgi:putative membrane protein